MAGFFEELPVMLVAVMAFLLTLAAVITGLQAYRSHQATSALQSGANGFLESLLGYANLTYQGQFGVFEADKVGNLTESNLSYDYQPAFEYRVSILDVSTYPNHYNRTVESAQPPVGTAGLRVGEISVSSSIDIWVSLSEVHVGILEVVAWR